MKPDIDIGKQVNYYGRTRCFYGSGSHGVIVLSSSEGKFENDDFSRSGNCV
jgi:hypothetical protein